MPKIETSPLPETSTLWRMVQPGDFIDGYVVESRLGPREAADIGLSMPKWASALLALRNRIVRPLGLKTEVSDTGEGAIFPVTYEDAQEVILGTDDTHLNFRILTWGCEFLEWNTPLRLKTDIDSNIVV